MCVIIWKPEGKKLSLDLVSELWDKNPDGAGYFLKSPDTKKWTIQNGLMKKDAFLEEIKPFVDEKCEFATHMRIKTVGTICAEHTHPFNWSNRKDVRWMMHNGTIRFLNPDKDSDSLMLSKLLTCVSTEEGHGLFKNFSENGFGRFLSLTGGKIEVFGDAESIWDDGIWFSNKRHKETTKAYNKSNAYEADYEPCNWQNYGDNVRKHSSQQLSLPSSSGASSIINDPARGELLKKLGIFYANKAAVAYSRDFQNKWETENSCKGVNTSILEKVVALAQADTAFKSDPLLDFYLAFKE